MDTNTVTVVTGGSRGIGKAIALRMAKEAWVVVVGRTEESLVSVRDEINARGDYASAIVGDVTDPATAEKVYDRCKTFTSCNLVLNAGIGKSALPHEYDDALFQSIMDVNVMGAFHFIKKFAPHMIAHGGGNIILMSSLSGLVGSRQNVPYTASKHALIGMAKSLAYDYGPHGIVSVALCPGYVETEMTERSIQKRMQLRGLSHDEARERVVRMNPQHRLIPPEEIAEMVAFICSGKVPSLSGSAVVLSGGA